MTPSPPTTAPSSTVPAPGGAPPIDGLGAPDWHLATCHRCDPDFSQPFRDEDERNDWAVAHVTQVGHTVHIHPAVSSTEHATALIRTDGQGAGYRWLCPTDGCVRWSGPYVSAQLALASWVSHRDAVR